MVAINSSRQCMGLEPGCGFGRGDEITVRAGSDGKVFLPPPGRGGEQYPTFAYKSLPAMNASTSLSISAGAA
jgi:hypothetical protein